RAEDQTKEKSMIGTQTEIQQDVPRHDRLQPSESTTGELAGQTEKPLMVPDSEGSLSMEKLITPSPSDFENARESDIQSAVSFWGGEAERRARLTKRRIPAGVDAPAGIPFSQAKG